MISDWNSFFLSINDVLKEFYRLAEQDECIQPATKQFYGHKQVKFLTPFEIACWAILTQRIPMKIAHRIKENIIQKLGGQIVFEGVEYRSFPEPSNVVALSANMFELVPNRKKAEFLSSVSEAFCKVDEQWLRKAAYDEVHDWLTDIKGFGEWSGNFIVIRGLGRMEELSNIEP